MALFGHAKGYESDLLRAPGGEEAVGLKSYCTADYSWPTSLVMIEHAMQSTQLVGEKLQKVRGWYLPQ
jgi:hypothetical protein